MTDSFPLTTTKIDPDTHYWTPQVQRAFLEALAVEGSVRRACQTAGKSWRTAYALRMQGRGAAFALGWDGAVLIARARLAPLAASLHLEVRTRTRPAAFLQSLVRREPASVTAFGHPGLARHVAISRHLAAW